MSEIRKPTDVTFAGSSGGSPAVLGFRFETLKLRRVAAWCDSRHTAARRLAEKLGMRREGEFVKNRMLHGEWITSLWFALLAEECQAAEPPAPPAG